MDRDLLAIAAGVPLVLEQVEPPAQLQRGRNWESDCGAWVGP